MRFLRVDVEDFIRIRAPYSLPLDNQGLVLVEGENRDGRSAVNSNGAGKSLAVVEVLMWGLYDRMVRYGDRVVGALAQNVRTGRADVTVHVDAGPFVGCIKRSRPPVSIKAFDADTPDTPRSLTRDPSRRGDEIATLLGMDFTAAKYAVVVQAAEALADGGFARQMAVIESLLRLDQLSAAAELERKESTDVGRQLNAARTERDLVARTLKDVEQVYAQLAEPATGDDEERAALTERIEAAETATKRLEALTAAVTRTEEAGRRARSKAAEENAALVPLLREKQEREGKLSSLVCSECQRPYGTEEETAEARRVNSARIGELTTAVNEGYARKQTADRESGTNDLRLYKQREELREHQRLADALPDLQRQVAALAQRAAERDAQLMQIGGTIEGHRAKLATLDATIEGLQPTYRRKSFWAEDFGREGLQASIFSSGLPELNRAAHQYSALLTGGLFRVQFQVDRERRSEDMIRLEGEASAPTYAGLSRGEKERTNLIVAMSLRALARWRLGRPINLTVYDEVFDHVDEKGLKVAADLLAEEAAGGNTVIVVTHNPQLKALFPGAKLIRIVREGGEAVVHYAA